VSDDARRTSVEKLPLATVPDVDVWRIGTPPEETVSDPPLELKLTGTSCEARVNEAAPDAELTDTDADEVVDAILTA
jgi:hypothetical protein